MNPFVLPDELTLEPHVGAAAAAGGLVGGSLEGEELTTGICDVRECMAHQGTYIIEVGLCGRGFLK